MDLEWPATPGTTVEAAPAVASIDAPHPLEHLVSEEREMTLAFSCRLEVGARGTDPGPDGRGCVVGAGGVADHFRFQRLLARRTADAREWQS